MRMGQGVRTGLGHGGITCVLQTQFSSLHMCFGIYYISQFSDFALYLEDCLMYKHDNLG